MGPEKLDPSQMSAKDREMMGVNDSQLVDDQEKAEEMVYAEAPTRDLSARAEAIGNSNLAEMLKGNAIQQGEQAGIQYDKQETQRQEKEQVEKEQADEVSSQILIAGSQGKFDNVRAELNGKPLTDFIDSENPQVKQLLAKMTVTRSGNEQLLFSVLNKEGITGAEDGVMANLARMSGLNLDQPGNTIIDDKTKSFYQKEFRDYGGKSPVWARSLVRFSPNLFKGEIPALERTSAPQVTNEPTAPAVETNLSPAEKSSKEAIDSALEKYDVKAKEAIELGAKFLTQRLLELARTSTERTQISGIDLYSVVKNGIDPNALTAEQKGDLASEYYKEVYSGGQTPLQVRESARIAAISLGANLEQFYAEEDAVFEGDDEKYDTIGYETDGFTFLERYNKSNEYLDTWISIDPSHWPKTPPRPELAAACAIDPATGKVTSETYGVYVDRILTGGPHPDIQKGIEEGKKVFTSFEAINEAHPNFEAMKEAARKATNR